MLRIVLGVIGGFFAWIIMWVGIEKILIAILPEWYGEPQLAFQHAVENQVDHFTAETRLLLSHIVIATVVAAISGFLASLIARENKRAPLVLGFLLLAVGLLKAVMSWPYVPIWYHVTFTAMLLPMAIIGGKLMTIKDARRDLVKFGVLGSKTGCQQSLRSGFIFGLWTRNEMNEVLELDYLESFLKAIHIEIEEVKGLETNKERFELITSTLSKEKEEFKLWFEAGFWTYVYTWLLGHDYYANETEEARSLIRENSDIRKAGSNFIAKLQDLDWSPDKIESFNIDKMIPFLWEEDLRKWVGNPDMAVMSDLRYEAKLLDLKTKEDSTESRTKSALKELISGIPIVGKPIGIIIFGKKT